MKITAFGAGRLGGRLANGLGRDPEEAAQASILARGAHLAAIEASGAKGIAKGAETVIFPNVMDDAGTPGPQDAVLALAKPKESTGQAA